MKKLLLALMLAVAVSATEIQPVPCFSDAEAPSQVQATWNNKPRGVLLTWQCNAANATGYRVYRLEVIPTGGTRLERSKDLPANSTGCLDKSARQNRTYYYAVVAVNDCGESAFYDCYYLP